MESVIKALITLIELEPDADPKLVQDLRNVDLTVANDPQLLNLLKELLIKDTKCECICDLNPIEARLDRIEANLQSQLSSLGKGVSSIDQDVDGLKEVISKSDGDFVNLIKELQTAIKNSKLQVSFDDLENDNDSNTVVVKPTLDVFQASYIIGDAKIQDGAIKAGESWTSGYRILGKGLHTRDSYVEWKQTGKAIFGLSAYPQAIPNPPSPGEGWINTTYGWYVRSGNKIRATHNKTHNLSSDFDWSPGDVLRIGFDQNGKLYWEIETKNTIIRNEFLDYTLQREYYFYGVFASSTSSIYDIKIVNK